MNLALRHPAVPAGLAIAAVTLACALPFGGATPTPAAPARTAQLSELRAAVSARASGELDWGEASEGQSIGVSGGVLTGAEARARLDTSEGSVIRLAANTQFELLEFPPAAADPVTRWRLDAGKVWVIVAQALGAGQFEIETPTGIAAVRGSLMSVDQSAGAGRLLITCLEGDCQLSNPASGATVDLRPGQQSNIASAGQDPAPAAPMDADQYQEWLDNVPEAAVPARAFLDRSTPTPPAPDVPGSLGGASHAFLAFDGQGTLHLVYETRALRAEGDYLHQRRLADGSWSEPINLTEDFDIVFAGGADALEPRPDGQVCVFWNGFRDNTDGSTEGLYQRCWDGAAWSAVERIIARGNAFAVAYSADGTMRLAYTRGPHALHFRGDGAPEDDPRFSEAVLELSLVVDARGGLHLAWKDVGRPVIEYSYSADDGQTWSPAEPLSSGDALADHPRLAADGQGNVHLVYFENDNWYRRWTPGSGWGEAVNLSGERPYGPLASLAVGPDGLLRAAWWQSLSVSFTRQTAGGVWSAPLEMPGTNLDVADPALAVDANGAAHLAWTDAGVVRYVVMP